MLAKWAPPTIDPWMAYPSGRTANAKAGQFANFVGDRKQETHNPCSLGATFGKRNA